MSWLNVLAQFTRSDFNVPNATPTGDTVKLAIQIVLGIFGAICLVMVTLGGFKYTASRGDSNSVKSAKDTILYALVGLFITMFAYTIVTFVVGKLS